MSIKYIYSKFENEKEVDKKKLADYLQITENRKRGHTLFNKQIYKDIFQPSDYCRNVENSKELIYRSLYMFLSKNQLDDALSSFIYLHNQYYANTCITWRAGFHILHQEGDADKLAKFFEPLSLMTIPDYSNMLYEYFLHLIYFQRFEEVMMIYSDSIVQRRLKPENNLSSEKSMIALMIKMTVAVSCYCIWKRSLNYSEDVSNGDSAELYFRELVSLINQGEMVDNYMVNYIDLLTIRKKYQEALEILLLYYEKCSYNFNSLRFLIDFVTEQRSFLIKGVYEDNIANWRKEYVWKMIPIYPEGDDFTVSMLIGYIEDLSDDDEALVKILFELLENDEWVNVSWPWQRLFQCIERLGVENEVVVELWNMRKSYWNTMYFEDYSHNINIANLASILL